MLHVATVADWRFLREAGHLKRSLLSSNPNARLTIYCDSEAAFSDLAGDRCALVELPEMAALGAKRSKMAAFRHAIDSGSFLYLDADAIVLEPLDELTNCEVLSGCCDDLSHCPYIEDKDHPWPNAPELRRNTYINSGVFYAPASRKAFFDELHRLSRIDDEWNKYIFPNCLFDNHFFCALLNLTQEPVQFLDPQLYGWQGFWHYGQLEVERRGHQLVNKRDSRPLKIAIFAGVRQSYDFLLTLPPDVASLLLSRILPDEVDSNEGLASYLAAANDRLATVTDPHVFVVLRQTIAELRYLTKGANPQPSKKSLAYFENPESMRAFACAQPPSGAEWNGLKCGGAYLEGEEYAAIRDIVRAFGIRTVVETGAGETSILFANLGVKAVSVESQAGPWLERAQAHGCTAFQVPFDDELAEFSEDILESKIRATGWYEADLLFIDSPVGTGRRTNLLRQFSKLLRFRYVMYHDAIRDSANIFRDQHEFGLRPARFLNTVRGLVLLENPAATTRSQLTQMPSQVPADATIDPLGVRISAELPGPAVAAANSEFVVRLGVENTSAGLLSSNLQQPVQAAYHWLDAEGNIVIFEGMRTFLPFDIESGDRCRFDMYVTAPEHPGQYELQVSLLQERVCWFHYANPACIGSFAVEVRPA
jgi:hypothetical protein